MAPITLREYLQTTEDAISSGRIDDALANCQHILIHFPEALEVQRLLGEVYLAQGQLEEAQQTFDWVLTNDPENVIAYCSRALTSERMSDFDTALDCYQQAYELSRGNSQIRQQFNQLSERSGQQGFIFSRAGLARLYMRGDLLPQAIQEWETVLAATPERLDARIGLLETCWHEGLYDRVEQLATQVLNEVPGCLKALLLLAHVTFPQNALQAQELMQQAKALDPDLVMAQELFSDFMVSRPKDPFLTLLRKPPTVFPETSNGSTTATTAGIAANSSNGTNAASAAAFSEPLVRWDSHIEPQQDYQAPQAGPLLRSDNTSEPAPWISLGEQERQPVQEVPIKAAGASSDEPEAEFDAWDTLDENAIARHEIPAEPWYMQPDGAEDSDADASHEQTNLEEQSWYHMLEETDVAPWSHANNIEPGSPAAVWDTEEQEGELPAPPAWLDKLTKGEFQPPPMPAEAATTPPVEQEPLTFMVKASPQEEAEAVLDTQVPADDSAAASQSSQEQEDEEPFFFGPEWLKSLGAAAIDSVLPQESETPLDVPVEPAQSSGAPEEAAAPSVQSETEQKISVASWLDQAAQKLGQTEQNVLTTLEELENDLRTQGFMQLEPGSFSTLAHEQALSSALAQLGNFGPQPIDEGQPSQTTQAETIPALPTGEPLWPATSPALSQPESPAQSVGSSSQEPTSATPETPAPSSHLEALAKYVSTSAPEPMTETMPEAARTDALASLVANAVPGPAFNASPASETHPSLDSELETTMKRPAVQLQPVQYRLPSQPGQAMTKGRPGERPSMGKAAEGSLSYKERLLKGYQYQLAGAYDEAMQEYRVIIRNAPEFLGDVVSNVRALLKLAPKYSAGYRILGDAYMRQGEYLQAMEAYNKALTMAKKAKA